MLRDHAAAASTRTSSASRPRDKDLDPALIAAVCYQESKFQDRTSHAGARGVMQLLPSTADYIARKSGGTEFEQGDLADPQINISYGSWYLRYLLDHYDGNERLAIAAYNAGETNVDRWVAEAGGPGRVRHRRGHPVPRDARLRGERRGEAGASTARTTRASWASR